MKSILLIGATLMVGAGIYGFIDYKEKAQSAAFKSLYRQEKPVAQQRPAPEVVTSPAPLVSAPSKKEAVVKAKTPAPKKAVKETYTRISSKSFSRAIPAREMIGDLEVPVEAPAPAPIKKAL